MTFQGVFRDDFYNAISVLPNSQASAFTSAAAVAAAQALSGAGDCYIVASGQTTATLTFDTAANIIAYLQQAVAVAYKNNLSGFGAGVNPPAGVPNFFNLSWTLTINNTNTGALTLSAGVGVTISALGGLSTTTVTAGTATAGIVSVFVVTVTSPTTVSVVRVQ